VDVIFTAPATGASGKFAGTESNVVTVTTNSAGIAQAPKFTTNALPGIFNITATSAGLSPVNFVITSIGWYVSPTGNDSATCNSPFTPCLTIEAAFGKIQSGDTIFVEAGTYTKSTGTEVVALTFKNAILSGGWNSSFNVQNGFSTIDGQNARRGISATAAYFSIYNFIIENGFAALSNRSGDGGGIWTFNSGISLFNSIVRNNHATGDGGGISGTVTINKTLIENNTADENGGGLSDSVTSYSSTIKNNHATYGGGLYIIDKDSKITNTLITKNTASQQGGGIYFNNPGGTINNTTIIENSSSQDGGGVHTSNFTPNTVDITNSIIANNAGLGSSDCYGIMRSATNSLIRNNRCSPQTGSQPITGIDPKLRPDILGFPGYIPLFADSPAINSGDPATCASTDQRGISRPQQGICDIGAFEYTIPGPIHSIHILGDHSSYGSTPGYALLRPLSVYALDVDDTLVTNSDVTFTAPLSGASGVFSNNSNTITSSPNIHGETELPAFSFWPNDQLGQISITTAPGIITATFTITNGILYVDSTNGSDTGGNSCTNPNQPCRTINTALNNAIPGEGIRVAAGTYDETILISKDIIITGGWDNTFTSRSGKTILDGNKTHQVISIPTGIYAVVEDVNITNGFASQGAGISNRGILTLKNVAIYNNTSTSEGAGIYQYSGRLNLTNVTISNNTAISSGGGVYVYDGVVDINNSTIYQNVASNLYTTVGGGLSNPFDKPVTISNTIIAGNIANINPDCRGRITSNGHNLVGYVDLCDISPANADQSGNSTFLNAMLGNLADNGGTTLTHALLDGSPAIDTGNSSSCTNADQRGLLRPQGTTCDIGAYEGSSSQTVSVVIRTYSSKNSSNLPGTLICDQTQPSCSNGNNPHADYAQLFAKGTYDLYLNQYNRRGIDSRNMPIISTVHYENNYDNAFWTGTQMVYGDAQQYPLADDVVAHELTHGVTQYESNLFYFYQSGAINESLSDIWGEYYDQNNGVGTDTPEVKWLHGEDTLPGGTGAYRSMSNPSDPRFNHPDKMTSSLYVKTDEDSGGVHSNSGVNNKAAFLMVDGGTFNGYTITGIGWDKTAAIYYEANTNLLSSGADYSDLYYAVQQACSNLSLTNYKDINSADCVQVKRALDAVQMNMQPVSGFNPEAAACPAGYSTGVALGLFSDNFENGTNNWTQNGEWYLDDFYAASPTHAMYGDDYEIYKTSTLELKPITLPAGTSYLHFKHAYVFDYYNTTYYDGGVLEYSINNGSTWVDAKTLYSDGKNYTGTLSTSWGNPIGGRSAFVGDSHGYVSSRYNLTSLAGKTARFRWVLGTDSENYLLGWLIDDVKVYTCMGTSAIPTIVSPVNNGLTTDYTPLLNWSDSTPNLHHYQLQVAANNIFAPLLYDESNLSLSQFEIPTDLPPNATYYWRVRSFNTLNETLGWSAVSSFRTAFLPPALLSPATGTTLPTTRPTFTWNAVSGATGYALQASTSSTFATYLVNVPVSGTSYTPVINLPGGIPLYWRVAATGANGPSVWSEVRNFIVTFMGSPVNNGYAATETPTFTWAAVPGALEYQLQVDKSGTFVSLELDRGLLTAVSTVSQPLDYGIHYWRMRVRTAGGWRDWTPGWKFTLTPPNTTVPVLNIPANAALLADNTPTLSWNMVLEDDRYEVQIDNLSTFASPEQTHLGEIGELSYTATTLPDGVYYWRVRTSNYLGMAGPWSAYRSVTIDTTPPAAPALSLPANAANLIGTPAFSWLTAATATKYQFEYATNSGFSEGLYTSAELTTLSHTPPAMTPGIYFWHVRSKDAAGNWSTAWSSTRTVTILPAPTLSEPANALWLNNRTPAFSWSPVPSAANYRLEIAKTSTFTLPITQFYLGDLTSYTATTLPDGIYYWHVRAINSNGTLGAWSAVRSFTIDATPPAAPALSLPANAATVIGTPAFSWLSAAGASKYQFEYATNSGFSEGLYTSAELTTLSHTPPAMNPGVYFWHVRSKDAAGNWSTAWSAARTVTILPVPTLSEPANALWLNNRTPAFSWSPVPSAANYRLEIAKTSTFTLPITQFYLGDLTSYTATTLPDGIYYWHVRAINSNGTLGAWSAVRSFTIDATPPPAPALSLPANAATVIGTPTFSWLAAAGASKYQFEYATNSGFSEGVYTSVELATLTHTPPAMIRGAYYWHVRSRDTAGNWSNWSTARTINIVPVTPATPALISPANGSINSNPTPTLSWAAMTGAVSYQVQLDNNSTFNSPELDDTIATNSRALGTNLADGIYYWRVRETNALNGVSAWSAVWRVTIKQLIPTAPVLLSPEGGSTVTTNTPEFSWESTPVGNTYQIQVDDNPDFLSREFDDSTADTNRTPTTALTNGTYYWRVRAINIYSTPGEWSETRSVSVSLP
jgi:hypothetical protein